MERMSDSTEVVYIVDDDARVREAIQDQMEANGRKSFGFASASEYMEHLREDTAACLILDLNLPDLSGLELQQQLVASTAPTIIFMSGDADIPSSVRAMKAGAMEFLVKPVDPQVLLATVEAGLTRDRKRRRRSAELSGLQARLKLLTPRERDVLPLIVAGFLNKQAAAKLGISEVTLQVHRGQIMRKMQAPSFAELVRMSERLGVRLPAPDGA